MKKLMRCLCVLGLGLSFALSTPVQAATPKKKASASQTSKTRSATRTRSKAPASKAGQVCQVQKIKGKNRRVCKAAPVDQVLSSPIQSNALNAETPAERAEVKVRSAPDRAYAVDGETFFFQGRKYRVAGLEGAGGSDMAKQRLQKSLESGTLAIDPLDTDEAGVSTAIVRVNGRNLAE